MLDFLNYFFTFCLLGNVLAFSLAAVASSLSLISLESCQSSGEPGGLQPSELLDGRVHLLWFLVEMPRRPRCSHALWISWTLRFIRHHGCHSEWPSSPERRLLGRRPHGGLCRLRRGAASLGASLAFVAPTFSPVVAALAHSQVICTCHSLALVSSLGAVCTAVWESFRMVTAAYFIPTWWVLLPPSSSPWCHLVGSVLLPRVGYDVAWHEVTCRDRPQCGWRLPWARTRLISDYAETALLVSHTITWLRWACDQPNSLDLFL